METTDIPQPHQGIFQSTADALLAQMGAKLQFYLLLPLLDAADNATCIAWHNFVFHVLH